jgi:hypothetical protein
MADQREPPMAVAMQWVARVFAVSLMMVLPGLGGQWLDSRWQTRFVGIAGFVLGLVGGMAYLIAMTRRDDLGRHEAARRKVGDGKIGEGTHNEHSAKQEASHERPDVGDSQQ